MLSSFSVKRYNFDKHKLFFTLNFLNLIWIFPSVPKDNVAVPAANDLPILQDEWGNDGYYDEYTGN